MSSLSEKFEAYRSNVFPGIVHNLAKLFNVSIDTLERLGIGYHPDKGAWVFPERDATGEIIGLTYRSVSTNKKWMAKGSKRGLTYALNENAFAGRDKYEPGRHRYLRIYEYDELTCPLCGRPDWCMVSADDPHNPSAVICPRTSEGAVRYIENCGYVHILKESNNPRKSGIIGQSEHPILIVEGYSDTATAIDLGFIAIGKPQATGGDKLLLDMPLEGKKVCVIGDNDAGIGKKGAEQTFFNLSSKVEDLTRIMPPQGIKDIRKWRKDLDLTQNELLDYIKVSGQKGGLEGVFNDDAPMTIINDFLAEKKTYDNVLTLRNYIGQWMEWQNGRYKGLTTNALRGELYRYLEDKQYAKEAKNGKMILPYKATRSKVSDIIDAASAHCCIEGDLPVWLGKEKKNFKRLISFKNGILDVDEYLKGDIKLIKPTPRLITKNYIPYDYDENANCDEWIEFLNDVFNEDSGKIKLLQQWMGYLLVPDMSAEKFMMFVGPTRAGKGTIIEVISSMLGENNCASLTLQSLTNRFGYDKLLGKLAAFLPDVRTPNAGESNYVLDRLLQIIGGDPINVDRKHIKEIPAVHLNCRFTIAVNEIPKLPDYADALLSRLLTIRLKNTYIGREDTSLKPRLKRLASEGKVINFALNGLKDLLEAESFHKPADSKLVELNFRDINNPIWAFINECCNLSKLSETQLMFDAWCAWCRANGEKPGYKNLFSKRLKSVVPDIKIVRKRTVDYRRIKHYDGISLQSWARKLFLEEP